MNLLLHTCCAPCSIYCIDSLLKEDIKPTIYWYNPNIHPYTEYKNRKEALENYAKYIDISYIIQDEYGLKKFCSNVINNLHNRCVYCYTTRLKKTAKYAKENGFDSISTTLLISPYQNHNLIKRLGEEIAKRYNLQFIYRDFRQGFREGQAKARQLYIYMQKYCGCIFSEEERYLRHKN